MLLQLNLALLCTAGLLGVVATVSSFEQQSTVHDVPRLSTVWANATYFVLIIGNRRGATTETAEHIGNHPCAASFNELVAEDHFPSPWDEYRKYKHGRSMARYLKMKKLDPNHQLASALKARNRFCNARPDSVKCVCGDTCVIAFKVHLDAMYISEVFYTDRRARAVVLERNRLQNFCSNFWALSHGDHGHRPGTHSFRPTIERPPCTLESVLPENGRSYFKGGALWKDPKGNYAAYDALVTPKFKEVRLLLNEHNRSTLELPFEEYIADTTGANQKLWEFAGLLPPPNDWGPVCPYAWCARKTWPFPL